MYGVLELDDVKSADGPAWAPPEVLVESYLPDNLVWVSSFA